MLLLFTLIESQCYQGFMGGADGERAAAAVPPMLDEIFRGRRRRGLGPLSRHGTGPLNHLFLLF